ncbi:Trk system potassium uptake protein TrkA [Methanosarcina siciliae T4/M]|uniref:Trk system potassium uptake protein TrkA n=2 Tax=Methanosarcina siciliae TaxID=38027 RepID=A0A0E3PDQ1_9EURY|nr:TrkA family potassium uptake protein [Methanosarcina siciliae]AKB28700.1 Trk system potassium uptake protein TrkA [Methanosarcina siciliae T4/M]AKB32627.1 Trk system potassium uptake protein TrkA [Methanosarcina siciliae HI350]
MRLIIIGASSLGMHLTRAMIRQGNEVILIEKDEEVARELAEELDCTVINAEGTHPDILDKAGMDSTDAIVACTNHDQDNILIGLIAQEAGVERVIVKTDDTKFMEIAKKLGISSPINPPHISSTIISDALRGIDTIELSNLIRADVRVIGFKTEEKHAGKRISDVQFPENTECIGFYRNNEFFLARENPKLEEGDELLIITRSGYIDRVYEKLREI